MGELHQLAEVREVRERRGRAVAKLTKGEIAAHFRVSPRTITRWMNRGMPFDRPYVNGAVRYSIAECESWARRHR